MSAAACSRSPAASSASATPSAGERRAASATPATARSARSNSPIRLSTENMQKRLTEKKRAPEGARSLPDACCLEAVRHADEERAHVRTEERGVGEARLVGRSAGPRELRVRLVVDLGVANADVGALREAMLVADVVLLRAGVREMHASRADRAFEVLSDRVRRPDRTRTHRYRQRHGVLLRLDVAIAGTAGRKADRARHALVLHRFIGDAHVEDT